MSKVERESGNGGSRSAQQVMLAVLICAGMCLSMGE